MKQTTIATVYRTQMIGGGTSYDVYFRCADKPSQPLHGYTYATEIHRSIEGRDGQTRKTRSGRPAVVWFAKVKS